MQRRRGTPPPDAGARAMSRCLLVVALARHRRQGVHPAEARPADVRHDRRHPGHPARAVRLRDQLRSEAPADGAARRRPQRVLAQHRERARQQRLLRLRRRGSGARRRPTARSRPARAQFVVTIPAGFSRALVRGERPAVLVEADATDPDGDGQRDRRARPARAVGAGARSHRAARAARGDARRVRGASCTRATTRRRSRSTTSCPGSWA